MRLEHPEAGDQVVPFQGEVGVRIRGALKGERAVNPKMYESIVKGPSVLLCFQKVRRGILTFLRFGSVAWRPTTVAMEDTLPRKMM